MSSLGILSGPNAIVRRSALGEEKKIYTTAGAQYWMDLFHHAGRGDQRVMFTDWVRNANKEFPGSVVVLVEEGDASRNPPWSWVKFQANESLPFPWQTLGIPNRIKPGEKINSADDTTTADESRALEDEEIDKGLDYLKWGLVIVAIGVGAHVLGNAAKVVKAVKE